MMKIPMTLAVLCLSLAAVTGARGADPNALPEKAVIVKPRTKPQASADQPGPLRSSLVELANRNPVLTLTLNQPRFAAGEALQVTVDLPTGGFLNIVNVGAEDNGIVLFPNQFHTDNRVAAGQLSLPTPQMGFDLLAGAPFGPSLIVAFLTSQPIDLYQNGDPLLVDGQLNEVFRTLSPQGVEAVRSFYPTARQGFQAGLAETRVCPTHDDC